MGEILIQLQIGRLQLNYINPLLYPVSVSGFPIPEHGVLGILIGDLNSKSALLLLTPCNARKRYTGDYWLFFSEKLEGE